MKKYEWDEDWDPADADPIGALAIASAIAVVLLLGGFFGHKCGLW